MSILNPFCLYICLHLIQHASQKSIKAKEHTAKTWLNFRWFSFRISLRSIHAMVQYSKCSRIYEVCRFELCRSQPPFFLQRCWGFFVNRRRWSFSGQKWNNREVFRYFAEQNTFARFRPWFHCSQLLESVVINEHWKPYWKEYQQKRWRRTSIYISP